MLDKECLMNQVKETITQVEQTPKKVWITAFVFCFLMLMCDGADIGILSFTLTSLKNEFGLTGVQTGALGSWSLLGLATGGLVGGWAADRFGRVKVIVLAVICFSLFTGYSGFSSSYHEFVTVRFLACLGLGSIYAAANTLMSEMVPTKHRTTVLACLMTGFTFGSLVITALSGWIVPNYGWRMLYFISSSPIILAILMWIMVPEPTAWKNAKTLKQLQSSNTSIKTKNSYMEILKNPKHRLMFILWTLSSGCLLFGYYGVSSWLPAYLEGEIGIKFKEMTIYMIGSFLTMMFAKVIAGYVADKIGRKKVFAFGTMGTAIFIPIIVYFHTPSNIGWLMLAFGFLYGVPYAINATYMTESFPTSMRATAVGGAYNVGRIGAVLSPITIGFFAQQDAIGVGFLIMGGAYFVCGLIPTLFIKERLYNPQSSD